MKYAIAAIAAWLLAVAGVAALPYFKIAGVTPDLVLVFAACWAVVRGQDEALAVVPLAGLIRDLVTSDPVGTSVLGLAPVVVLALAVRLRTVDSQFVDAAVVVAAGSLAYAVISALVLASTGQRIELGDVALRSAIPLAVVNALFTPVAYLPLRWLTPQQRLGLGAGRLGSQV